jgi:hypothetical protein
MRTARVAGAVLAIGLVGCGGGASASAPKADPRPIVARSRPGLTCSQTVGATLRQIAARIYHQAVAGRNVATSRRRLAGSAALSAAVARGDAAGTRRALRPLLKNQIHRIEITRGGRVLTRYGTTAALAPVHGVIRAGGRPVGRYTMAIGTDSAIAGVTSAVTGEDVVMRAGGHQVASTLASGAAAGHGTATILHGTAFPSGPLTISLQGPTGQPTTCGADGAATVLATVGAVGERLFRSESSGRATARALRHVALDAGFQTAMAHDDPAALRRAIVRFFKNRTLHVVRIRATTAGGHLINDVGGPFVLAPASRTVRTSSGRTLGRVTLSVQDDTGYIKLMHRFTGAHVALRTAAGLVPGSSHMRTGRVFSFVARAFPTGPLHVTLRIPAA